MRPTHRFHTVQSGIESWHTLSASAHYDPALVNVGPVVGVDEHLVDPCAGFDWHAHRGVHIVSWILEGTLRHEDSNGVERLVGPGVLLVQSTGDGIRHRETNASDVEPLRFVQVTIVGEGPISVHESAPPLDVAGVTVSVDELGLRLSLVPIVEPWSASNSAD